MSEREQKPTPTLEQPISEVGGQPSKIESPKAVKRESEIPPPRSDIIRAQEKLQAIEDRIGMIRRLILLEEDARSRASELEGMKSRYAQLSDEIENLPRNFLGRIKDAERAAILKYQMTGLETSSEAKKISLDLLLQDIDEVRNRIPLKAGESSADVLGQYVHLQEQAQGRLLEVLQAQADQQAA